MPSNTNEDAQKQRRRMPGKCHHSDGLMVMSLSMPIAPTFLCAGYFWSAVMLIAGLLELGMIVPGSDTKTRLNEIEGGEDAAAQY